MSVRRRSERPDRRWPKPGDVAKTGDFPGIEIGLHHPSFRHYGGRYETRVAVAWHRCRADAHGKELDFSRHIEKVARRTWNMTDFMVAG